MRDWTLLLYDFMFRSVVKINEVIHSTNGYGPCANKTQYKSKCRTRYLLAFSLRQKKYNALLGKESIFILPRCREINCGLIYFFIFVFSFSSGWKLALIPHASRWPSGLVHYGLRWRNDRPVQLLGQAEQSGYLALYHHSNGHTVRGHTNTDPRIYLLFWWDETCLRIIFCIPI